MSVKVDLNKETLTEEERTYLLERGQQAKLRVHDRRHGHKGNVVSSPPTDVQAQETSEHGTQAEQLDWEAYVDGLDVEELREHLDERDLDSKGNKAALAKRLKAAGPPEDKQA